MISITSCISAALSMRISAICWAIVAKLSGAILFRRPWTWRCRIVGRSSSTPRRRGRQAPAFLGAADATGAASEAFTAGLLSESASTDGGQAAVPSSAATSDVAPEAATSSAATSEVAPEAATSHESSAALSPPSATSAVASDIPSATLSPHSRASAVASAALSPPSRASAVASHSSSTSPWAAPAHTLLAADSRSLSVDRWLTGEHRSSVLSLSAHTFALSWSAAAPPPCALTTVGIRRSTLCWSSSGRLSIARRRLVIATSSVSQLCPLAQQWSAAGSTAGAESQDRAGLRLRRERRGAPAVMTDGCERKVRAFSRATMLVQDRDKRAP
mmetsp:Transcript_42893/g.97825  ORF Transcript_42893/g.97825 Transcript_42893/m.97825 type:complete len:331 (+) Transcript_42893:1101-2093(+)